MKIIFCIPGRNFSNNFLVSWTKLLKYCNENGIQAELSNGYTSIVHLARYTCLGINPQSDCKKCLNPFGQEIEYDYIMWIDSDIIFKPSDFFKLLEHDKDMVSGLYLRQPAGGTMDSIPIEYACLSKSDKSLWTNEVNGEMIEVFGNGMGWMLVKKGVFEKTPFPWFGPIIEGLDFNGEDVAFQMRAKDAGFPSYVDTNIIVGHEKGVILK